MVYWCVEMLSLDDDGPRVNHEPRVRLFKRTPEYEKAINQKKLEEQAALTLIEVTKQKEELLKQAEIEKNISITKAEAEAKALQIKGQSIASNPRIVELEWINKWNGELPAYMFGGSQSVILGMPNK